MFTRDTFTALPAEQQCEVAMVSFGYFAMNRHRRNTTPVFDARIRAVLELSRYYGRPISDDFSDWVHLVLEHMLDVDFVAGLVNQIDDHGLNQQGFKVGCLIRAEGWGCHPILSSEQHKRRRTRLLHPNRFLAGQERLSGMDGVKWLRKLYRIESAKDFREIVGLEDGEARARRAYGFKNVDELHAMYAD